MNFWRNAVSELNELGALRALVFTRISFSHIPEIKDQLAPVIAYYMEKYLHFIALHAPARGYSRMKQVRWTPALRSALEGKPFPPTRTPIKLVTLAGRSRAMVPVPFRASGNSEKSDSNKGVC